MINKLFPKFLLLLLILGCNPNPNNGIPAIGSFPDLNIFALINTVRNQFNSNIVRDKNDLYATNGRVFATALRGKTLYIGGQFEYVGPETGHFAVVNTDGNVLPEFPYIEGQIESIVSDGNGGWFVGGYLEKVNGVSRAGLIHINPDNSWDEKWDAQMPPGSGIKSMVIYQSNLYVGGSFFSVGGMNVRNLAKLDVTTGQADENWNFDTQGYYVSDLTLVQNFRRLESTLYVAGFFVKVQNATRSNLASIDLRTNRLNSWAPIVSGSTGGAVFDLEVEGSIAYIGGSFVKVGSEERVCLAAIDRITSELKNWNPVASGTVEELEVANGIVFIGGGFLQVAGQSLPYLAAINAQTGVPLAWNPNPSGSVYALKLQDNNLYVGGSFKTINSKTRLYGAAYSLNDFQLTNWHPKLDNYILAIATDNERLGLGGFFSSVGGKVRSNLAALDMITGTITDWQPASDSFILTMFATDSRIYVGGTFNKIGAYERERLAAIDPDTGGVLSWKANASYAGNPHNVLSIDVKDGVVYFGGFFNQVNGIPRNNLAAVEELSGIVKDWKAGTNSVVNVIKIVNDNLYIGGQFSQLNESFRSNLGAVDLSTGQIIDWSPTVTGGQPYTEVKALETIDSDLYIGGHFSDVSGNKRSNLAAINLYDSTVQDWNPNIWADPNSSSISSLKFYNSRLYVGGQFYSSDMTIQNLTAFSKLSSEPLRNWLPNPDGPVDSISFSPDFPNDVFVSGQFWKTFNEEHRSISKVPNASLPQ
ncbi:PQQ-binding-like beta-propeller repeat protein [Leptospira yasudae]|uniref:PQQ-binding-like beta-propeller repeat protein n=1 Tax=Leptospira yasudae TaxID=2202201 RepID=UPI001090E1A2|nr:PQQ-binding-like beta-propeller repeat protein [Leptospira yasudae]TGN02438.1 hypothetical protein EHR10_00470 [Leptospira yasudae]